MSETALLAAAGTILASMAGAVVAMWRYVVRREGAHRRELLQVYHEQAAARQAIYERHEERLEAMRAEDKQLLREIREAILTRRNGTRTDIPRP